MHPEILHLRIEIWSGEEFFAFTDTDAPEGYSPSEALAWAEEICRQESVEGITMKVRLKHPMQFA